MYEAWGEGRFDPTDFREELLRYAGVVQSSLGRACGKVSGLAAQAPLRRRAIRGDRSPGGSGSVWERGVVLA